MDIRQLFRSVGHPWQRMQISLLLIAQELEKPSASAANLFTVASMALGIFPTPIDHHIPVGLLGPMADQSNAKCCEILTLLGGVRTSARQGNPDIAQASVAKSLAGWIAGAFHDIAEKQWVQVDLAAVEFPLTMRVEDIELVRTTAKQVRDLANIKGYIPYNREVELGRLFRPLVERGIFDRIGPPALAACVRHHMAASAGDEFWPLMLIASEALFHLIGDQWSELTPDKGVALSKVLEHECERAEAAAAQAARVAQVEAKPHRRRRRSSGVKAEKPLTGVELTTLTVVAECGGSVAAAARKLEKDPKTVWENLQRAMKKMGRASAASRSVQAGRLPRDRRGQELVKDDENGG